MSKNTTLHAAKLVLKASMLTSRLKKEGDIHIQNVYRIFQKWVEKSDPLRDAIKAIIFGLIYGKSAATLGTDTKLTEFNALKAKIGEAHKANNKKLLAELEAQYQKLVDEDRSDYAQSIIDKVFAEFESGHKWILKMQNMATEKFYVFSPIGRIRHLYAAMTKDRRIVAKQVRRGMNAPIQGFASEIAVKSSRLVMLSYYKSQTYLKEKLKLEGKYPIEYSRIVHDAQYYMVPFEMVIPFIHILQYDTTYGIANAYEKEFGLKFVVEPEIEIEVGVKDTTALKWDWALSNIISNIDAAVTEGVQGKLYSESREDILEKIFKPWHNKEVRSMLQAKYPLLNVSDLDAQIAQAMKEAKV